MGGGGVLRTMKSEFGPSFTTVRAPHTRSREAAWLPPAVRSGTQCTQYAGIFDEGISRGRVNTVIHILRTLRTLRTEFSKNKGLCVLSKVPLRTFVYAVAYISGRQPRSQPIATLTRVMLVCISTATGEHRNGALQHHVITAAC